MGCLKITYHTQNEPLDAFRKNLKVVKGKLALTQKLGLNYYAFGWAMPGRQFSGVNYRYGFNGMEKDNEIKDKEGTSYDFGARIYDPRLGRWMSLDPLANKYPDESPSNFAGNNPIYFTDPNGEEKIAVAGAQFDKSSANKLMFVNQAMRQLRQYKEEAPDESRTLVLFTAKYTEKQINRITKVAMEKYGAKVILINSSINEFINYVNSKDKNDGGDGDLTLSFNRIEDPISSLDIFSHGVVGSIEFGYALDIQVKYSFNENMANKINGDAFSENSTICSYACRTGIGEEGEFFVFSSGKPEKSLAQSMANKISVNVQAFMTRSDYSGTLGSSSDRFYYKLNQGSEDFVKSLQTKEIIDGADFRPEGAVRPVTGGTTPGGVTNSKKTYTPEK